MILKTKLKKKKINKILLTCNKESIGFYKKRGFKIKKTIDDKNLHINRYLLEKDIMKLKNNKEIKNFIVKLK